MGNNAKCRGNIAQDSVTANNHASFKAIHGCDSEELYWLAEVILGGEDSVNICISDAICFANGRSIVDPLWFERWLKRCVARTALDRVRADILQIANNSEEKCSLEALLPFPDSPEAPVLRSFRAKEICENLNAFQRAVLVLHFYLGFSALDCALLIGCSRSSIIPTCASAFRRLLTREHQVLAERERANKHRSAEVAA